MSAKYPHVLVKLSDQEFDPFKFMGMVVQGMRESKVPEAEVRKFSKEVMASGNDEYFLETCREWVTVL